MMGRVGMNSKILLGVGVSVIAIIAVIVISVLEDESSLAEQKIRESIQNAISKSPKITGVHAQNICEILDLECPSNKTFQAVFDPNDGYTKFTYSKSRVNTSVVDYNFRIIDNELEYKTNRNPTEWRTFGDDSWMWDDDLTSNVSIQSKSYDYEDVCGFPVTDEMRLDVIYEESTHFTNDGLSYLKVRGGVFSHVELAQYYDHQYPSLEYWFTLKNGQQVNFRIGACGLIDGSYITLGTSFDEYYKIKSATGEAKYEQISAPGFPMVNTVTMQPVLDIENCQRISEYYTKMQSDTMFTRENVTFDPLWKNQVFPLMDYCIDVGNYELKILDGMRNWSFTVK